MLDRKLLRQEMFAISEKELHYKQHPEDSLVYFSRNRLLKHDSHGTSNELFWLPAPSNTLDPLYSHRVISSGRDHQPIKEMHLAFKMQSRFGLVPLHRHKYIELNYVYAGHCTQIINGKTVEMQAGDVSILDSDVEHKIEPTEENDILLNCLIGREYFTASFLERLASSGPVPRFLANAMTECNDHDHYLLFHTESSPVFRDLFECVFCEYLDPDHCSPGAIDSYMNLIFIELARCYQGAKESEYRRSNKNYLTEILRYLDDHCIDCTLESTAAHFGFHPNYLSRIIREGTGTTFKDLVADGRLSRAAFLLLTTDAPISQIANQCGYTNQSFFYKKFQERYGCTPAAYRQEDSAPSQR